MGRIGIVRVAHLCLFALLWAGWALAEPPQGSSPRATQWVPQRPEFEELKAKMRASDDPIHGLAQIDTLRSQLARPDLPPAESARLLGDLTMELLRLGDQKEALSTINRAFEAVKDRPVLSRSVLPTLHRIRGMAHLRDAEISNCIQRHNRDCCIFPLQGGGVHTTNEPALRSREDFLAYWKFHPGDLRARWLLNILSMAIGDYPQGLPADILIPPQAFESAYDIKRFPDIAPQLKIDTFNLAGGLIIEDFDHNGWLDIVTSTSDLEGSMTYYANLGDGRFENRSASSRLDDQFGGLNCVGADYNNDGYMDILVLRGGWLLDNGRMRKSMLRNNRDGTFTDVTRAAGLADPPMPTQTAAWADYDNDGDLDMYVGNESRVHMDSPTANFPCQLYRNNDEPDVPTFTDIASQAGVTNDRYTKGVAAGDYDNDGDMDIYVSNIGWNRLYRNNGDNTFTDVAEELGVTENEGRSFPTWFFDYDNDGWLDLFVAGYQGTVEDVAADYLGMPHKGILPSLFRNDRGRFVNVTKETGLAHMYLPMGANFGDLDNDGFLDIYLTTGDPYYGTLTPNIMLRNDGGKRFQDVTTSGGFGHLQKGHGVGFADFDHDGDQDIYHELGGFYPGDKFHNVLFENPGHGNHFLTIDVVGVKTNRRGIGARIKIVVATPDGRREIHRAVGAVSSFGGSPLRQEIGLGNATAIERLEVDWPTSKTKQSFENIPIDAMIRVTEGASAFERLEMRAVSLRAAP